MEKRLLFVLFLLLIAAASWLALSSRPAPAPEMIEGEPATAASPSPARALEGPALLETAHQPRSEASPEAASTPGTKPDKPEPSRERADKAEGRPYALGELPVARESRLEALLWKGPKARNEDYDLDLIDAAKRLRLVDLPFFKNGTYDLLAQTVEREIRWVQAKVALSYPDQDELLQGIGPRWLRYKTASGQVESISYEGFASPFREGENFGAAIHFPNDAFWKVIDDGVECAEILVLPDSWALPAKASGTVAQFNARAYCRKGADIIRPIAQIAFCHEDEPCP